MLNDAIASNMVGVFLSQPSSTGLVPPLSPLVSHMCAHPAYRLLTARTTPQVASSLGLYVIYTGRYLVAVYIILLYTRPLSYFILICFAVE